MSKSLTYLEMRKAEMNDGSVPAPIELLSQKNDAVNDIPWKETNQQDSEFTLVRVGLPTVYYRIMNQGTQISSGEVAPFTVDCAKLEAWCEIDTEVLRKSGDPEGIKAIQSAGFIEKMSQTFAYNLFYSNSSIDTEQFTGFAPQYASLSATSGQNIINAGGSSTDNCSIWKISWGPTVTGIVPKGTYTGWKQSAWEKGVRQTNNTAGSESRMDVETMKLEWYHGLAVKDWRDCVRICNIARSALAGGTLDLTSLMDDMLDVPTSGLGRDVIYMRRDTLSVLRRECKSDVASGGGLTYDVVDGRPVTNWRGIPIRIVDQLLDTEATIS